MNLTDGLKLPCPDDADPAAIALYMQRLAEQIDTELAGRLARARSTTHQPTAIWDQGPDSFSFGPSGLANLSIPNTALVFANYTMPDFAGLPAPPRFSSEAMPLFPVNGLYHVSLNSWLLEVGAVTADSFRRVRFQVFYLTPSGEFELRADGSNLSWSVGGVGGGVWIHNELTVDVFDAPNFTVVAQFTHDNAASNMRWERKWASLIRIGGPDIIEVV